jgi:hypothetical protein
MSREASKQEKPERLLEAAELQKWREKIAQTLMGQSG